MKIKSKTTDTLNILTVIILLTALVSALQVTKIYNFSTLNIVNKSLATPPINNLTYSTTTTYTTSDIDIYGKIGIIYDASNNHIIWSKDSKKIYPLASITKVMTAYTAMNDCSYDNITIESKYAEDSLDLGLQEGDEWTKIEAIKYMLTISSNDIANMLAYNCGGYTNFIKKMNQNSSNMHLGLHFINPSGVDENDIGGGMGTAEDIAKLLSIASAKYPEIYEATTYKYGNFESDKHIVSKIPNTNSSIIKIRSAQLSKTGTTDLAGGNLGIVYNNNLNQKIVIIVLGSGKEERFKDVQNLYNFISKI